MVPRIGKYTVVTKDLEGIDVCALNEATEGPAKLVLVYEIGPTEMTSRAFRNAMTKLPSHKEIVIATVKYGSHYPEPERPSEIAGTVSLEVSRSNREEVMKKTTSIVNSWMERR
jgi:nucleoside-triphosphatase THEP1